MSWQIPTNGFAAGSFFNSIIEKGLLPKERQYVHLSQDVETAYSVGMRHDTKPCILKINAVQAWIVKIDNEEAPLKTIRLIPLKKVFGRQRNKFLL